MSNFKSKFLLGVVIVAFAVVGFASTAKASTCDLGTTTLKFGMKANASVACLQTILGVTPAAGNFGPITLAAVKAFQTTNSLTADGAVGALTKAALSVTTPVVGTLPAGCTTASGFSTTTGVACTAATLPAGCTSTAGFSSTTGASCSTGSSSTALTGGAGTLDLTKTTANVETKATESKDDVKILGFKAKATDSDIAITNVKLALSNTNFDDAVNPSSEKLTDYVNSVSVWMGDVKVGEADASTFTRTSGSPDVFTKSIAISNAVIKEGKTNTFYVEVSSTAIDTADMHATWLTQVDSVRYEDATGVIMSDSYSPLLDKTFDYQNSSANDLLTIKTDSVSPLTSTVSVDNNTETKGVLIGAFKLAADADSSDITLNEIPVVVTFGANGTADAFADNVISSLYVKIDGTQYDAELATTDERTTNGNGTGYATYRVDLTDAGVTINAGDTSEVKIYADLGSQDGYANLTTVSAKVYTDIANTDCTDALDHPGHHCAVIDAEGADALTFLDGTMKGTFVGKTQTLSTAGAAITNEHWSVSSTGTIIDFFFTVNANNNEDFDVLGSSIIDTAAVAGTATALIDTPNAAAVVVTGGAAHLGVLTKYSGDAVGTLAAHTGWKVFDGNTTTFRVRYTLTATAAADNGKWTEITTTSVAGIPVADDTQTSTPTATVNL